MALERMPERWLIAVSHFPIMASVAAAAAENPTSGEPCPGRDYVKCENLADFQKYFPGVLTRGAISLEYMNHRTCNATARQPQSKSDGLDL